MRAEAANDLPLSFSAERTLREGREEGCGAKAEEVESDRAAAVKNREDFMLLDKVFLKDECPTKNG